MDDKTCGKAAAFRYTWVNGQSGLVCQCHADKMKRIAGALGCHVELDPVVPEDGKCEQKMCANRGEST